VSVPAPAPSAGGWRCEQVDELMSELLADELTEGLRQGVEAHLGACARCDDVYRRLRRTVRFVRAHADTPLTPGTPGGAYWEFTKDLMQDDASAAEAVLREGIPGLAPEGGRS
jgi:anti-sigma factor RsiW